jgi:DNA-binding transcriptional ArsR family regulator
MLTTATRLDAMARLGKALADPTRCRILIALLDGAQYPARLADQLGLTRSNVSNHLTCLRGCGLIVGVDEGRQTRYQIADPRLAHAINDLLGVVLAVDNDTLCLNHDTTPAP